jgi:hypothetical protein
MRRRYVTPLLLGSLLLWGCAPKSSPDSPSGSGGKSGTGGNGNGNGTTGSGGSNSGSGGNGNGTTGSGGSNSGSGGSGNGTTGSGGSNSGSGGSNSGSGGSGTTGSGGSNSSSGGAGGAAAAACVPDLTNLVNSNAWICALDTPVAIQGAIYPYGDGASCPYGPNSPSTNICTTGSCCISGTTVVDPTFAKWGCGIGMELDSSGGTTPVKSMYTGAAQCFDITLTGSSGGNVVRVGFTQEAMPTTQVSPYVELAPFTAGWTGRVCFTDAECPSWAVTAGTCTKAVGTAGTPYDLQIQVSAGSTATTVGAYNVCVSTITPVTDPTAMGTTNSCSAATGTGTITSQFGTAHVTCNAKDYIVQNNEWGSTAGQTITYGTGTKFKVTVQNGTGASGNPASFPSVFTGIGPGPGSSLTTAGSGLPLAVSAIAAGGVKTSWTWAANGATGSYNATYDVWFNAAMGDAAAAAPTGGFLMVWYHKPSANQPIGAIVASATIAGKTWNVWYGNNASNGKPCVSYVAQTDIASMSFSLGDFIRDAVTRTYLQNSWYLTNVFSGFEIWSGGIGLETTDFAVTVP